MTREQLEYCRDAEIHHHSCACGKCFSDQANFRSMVRALAMECLTLKDRVDALEAGLDRIIKMEEYICTDSCQSNLYAEVAREVRNKGSDENN